jgi:Zn-dependent protease
MLYSKSKYAFTNKTYSQKVFISLAGILMNLWSGLVSYCIFLMTYNPIFFYFAYYSVAIGLSNLLPIPALDGSFIFAFLLEKKLGKKKAYTVIASVFSKWLRWLLILNVLSIPYLGWLIWTGAIK